ncbi:MAG: WbqC family protein [Flammeovirgaceae bacterium]|nr:WbqC family protein [Flammeovirgaceae bacterium]
MNRLVIEPHYFPSLEFFCAILSAEQIIFEKNEHYVKQSYRNRCYINTNQGPLKLVVPVIHEPDNKTPFHMVRIDYSKNWIHHHWQSIQTAYGKAPFFEFYCEEIKHVLQQNFEKLYELNIHLLSLCLKWLGVESQFSETVSYEKVFASGVEDFRSVISPKIPYSGRSIYRSVPYAQVFGNKFAPNLSFLDLLFGEGPRSLDILMASKKGEQLKIEIVFK